MKILIGDEKRIQSFEIPKIADNFYMLNFKYVCNNQTYNETLTLKQVNGESWGIIEDEKLKIYYNGEEYQNTILQENLQLDLVFADLPQICTIYVVSDYIQYVPYTTNNIKEITIGSAANCNIHYENPEEEKITITNNNNVWHIVNEKTPIQKTFINKTSYKTKRLNNGDTIFINGISIIFLNQFILINPYNKQLQINNLQQIAYQQDTGAVEITPVTDIEKNVKLFNEDQLFVHTPQLKNEITQETIYIEEPPAKDSQEKQPILFTLISSSAIFATSALSLLTSLRNFTQGKTEMYTFAIECATCGIMLITSVFLPFLTNRWASHNANKKERMRKKKYKKYLEEKNKELNDMLKKQEEILKLNNTPLDQIISNIENNSNEIWGRQISDNDFLNIEVGKGNIKSQINIIAPEEKFEVQKDALKEQAIEFTKRKNELENVPIAYSLIKYKIAPFIITSKFREDYIKSIMLQLMYYHSGLDLKLLIITSEENEDQWDYVKYLPHNWDKKHEKRFFATNESELQTLSSYIEQEYDLRQGKYKEENVDTEKYKKYNEYFLIVTDNFKLARELPVLDRLQEKGNMGFSIIIFERILKNLPSHFPILFTINDSESMIVDVESNNNTQTKFTPSYLENINIEKAVNKIANIPVQFGGAEASIPTSLTFLEMFNVGRIEQLNVLSRWEQNNPTVSLKSTIGFKENNTPIELDLHEKFHGPHGLIAGSTGSGKSEFIISYILSLAVNYHPYEVQFVLIDYKGGGLAGAFENREKGIKLPHLVGTITNLDKSEMNRTLVSINSELQRRQRVFNETRERLGEGTIDIYKYQRLYRDKKVDEPMSHLFIISDEFAELKSQQPEFMDELVSAARIGRSLGIHLILATQKPTGVVDDQIWSNTRFRICLKVQTPEDSSELLKKPDAAYIKQSGRFYLQVGADEIYELGQSGWSGAKYIKSDTVQKKVEDNISFVENDGDIYKTVNETKKEQVQQEDLGEQLINIVNYLYDIANKQEIKFNQLWLPNIPETIYYGNVLKKYDLKPTPYLLNPIIGEYDNPANQEQGYVNFNILESGNTVIAGLTGTGKTTLLSTILYDSILNHNTDEVNIYIIDLAQEKLKIFQNAPQVGEVLTINDKDKIKFLFYMLENEKEKRLSYYSLHGGSFEKDIQSGKSPFPNTLVIINDYEVFRETFEDIYDTQFGPFTRNCTKVGITFIITSTSFGTLGYNADGNFPKKIALTLNDPQDYEGYFKNPPIPKKNPGRGVIQINENSYEFQASLINIEDQIDNHIRLLIAQLAKFITKRAPKVPVVPDEITIKTLEPYIKNLNAVPLGIYVKTAQIATYDFTPTLNTITARSHLPAKKFIPKLITILEKINSTKIMIVNSINDIRLEPTEKTKVFTDNFKDVIKVINTNVNNLKEVITEEQYIIIFVGYYQLQKTLAKEQATDPSIITIDDVIDNSKSTNFSYIVYDNDEYLEKLGDGRLDSIFKRNNGIWLGKEFDMQTLYDVSNPYSDQAFTNSHVILVNNTESQISKFD